MKPSARGFDRLNKPIKRQDFKLTCCLNKQIFLFEKLHPPILFQDDVPRFCVRKWFFIAFLSSALLHKLRPCCSLSTPLLVAYLLWAFHVTCGGFLRIFRELVTLWEATNIYDFTFHRIRCTLLSIKAFPASGSILETVTLTWCGEL